MRPQSKGPCISSEPVRSHDLRVPASLRAVQGAAGEIKKTLREIGVAFGGRGDHPSARRVDAALVPGVSCEADPAEVYRLTRNAGWIRINGTEPSSLSRSGCLSYA